MSAAPPVLRRGVLAIEGTFIRADQIVAVTPGRPMVRNDVVVSLTNVYLQVGQMLTFEADPAEIAGMIWNMADAGYREPQS